MRTNKENVDVEYKSIYVQDIRKDIVAFANTEGGTLYIGINDDGTVAGVIDADDIMLRLAGSLKDSIAPDIMPFVQIRSLEKEGKTIIVVSSEMPEILGIEAQWSLCSPGNLLTTSE